MKTILQLTYTSILTILLLGVTPNVLASEEESTAGFDYKIPSKIMTPDSVNTRIGELTFYDGIPTEDTLNKVYDNLDFVRAVDVFLNFIPANSIEGMRIGMKSLGVDDSNEVLVFDNLMDSAPLFLTGNNDTVYACAMLDHKKSKHLNRNPYNCYSSQTA